MRNNKLLPLEGIRVIEIATAWAGPVCGRMLADMGAEVIKIENPERPDSGRMWPPYADAEPGVNRSGFFATMNLGKKSSLLDLKQPESIKIVKQLIKKSDIVVENFHPGVMDKLGLSYTALRLVKPDLIMISLSGYGATGTEKDCVAYGEVLEAYAGLSSLIGYPGSAPQGSGPVISNEASGVIGMFAILAALHYRDLTGEGQYIDISEVETLLACMPEAIMEFTMNGRIPVPNGNRERTMAPHGCYKCRGEDKWVAISVGTDSEWRDLCLAMGRPELIADERFQDGFSRLKNHDELDSIISGWTRGQSPIDVMAKLQDVNVAAGPVYSAEELYKDQHLMARDFFIEVDDPVVGKRKFPGPFAKLSETPGTIRSHAPLLGEHSDLVLRDLLGDCD